MRWDVKQLHPNVQDAPDSSYLLPLQFLLFPPLPLFIIYFADLDEPFLLHTNSQYFIYNTKWQNWLNKKNTFLPFLFPQFLHEAPWETCENTTHLNLIQTHPKSTIITKMLSDSLPVQCLVDQLSLKPVKEISNVSNENKNTKWTCRLGLVLLDYPVHGSRSKVFSELVKRPSTFPLGGGMVEMIKTQLCSVRKAIYNRKQHWSSKTPFLQLFFRRRDHVQFKM